jgi:hypothetical protein
VRWWIGALVALALLAAIGWWAGRRSVEVRRADQPPPPSTSTAPPTAPSPSPSPSPSVARVAPRRPAHPHALVHAAWGEGSGQLGRKTAHESAPEGPMSLTVDRSGNLYVLDEINRRIQRWSKAGAPLPPIPLNGDTAQDLALGKRGNVALLDRLGERNLQLVSADGKPLGEVGLVGKHIPEGGGTTGLFTDDSGNFYVEYEHQAMVRVADSDGNSDADRPTVPGRPSRDGRIFLGAALADRAAGTAMVRGLDAAGNPLWQSLVSLGGPLLYLTLLDSDADGNVYLAGHTAETSPQPPYPLVNEQLVLVSLSPDGAPRGLMALPASPPVAENFRELAVGDDGTLYRMILGEGGVTVETYHF